MEALEKRQHYGTVVRKECESWEYIQGFGKTKHSILGVINVIERLRSKILAIELWRHRLFQVDEKLENLYDYTGNWEIRLKRI